MAEHSETMTIELPSRVRPVLDGIAGETPDQKIANLLIGEIRHNLEACEQERLAVGDLGDEFEYTLELDALKWDDLIAEKKHWLQQLGLLRDSVKSQHHKLQ
jgi:hypothetical protein